MAPILAQSVRSDLSAFCDVGTELEIAENEGVARFRFLREGKEYSGQASFRNDVPEYSFVDFPRRKLREVLASQPFADLEGFVRNQLQAYRDAENDFSFRNLTIDGTAELDLGELLVKIAQHRSSTDLLLVVIDGPAGVGKTRLIKRICLSHARDFAARRAAVSPTLYVSSRGRRLSRLDDAIAASLQDVRAHTVYTEVPSLVRAQALSLAIDGFDELANPEGYTSAWRTFDDFVNEIGGRGTLIISARDTFFDAQDFSARLEAVRSQGRSLQVIEAHITEPRWRYAQDFLRERGHASVEMLANIERLVQPTRRPYALRPVFLDLIRTWVDDDLALDIPFRELLVESFLERESKLLGFAPPADVGLRNGLTSTFQEIAGEMFDRDRDWVDHDTLALVLEITLRDKTSLPSDAVSTLVAKASSLGFMEEDARESKARRFPHDEIRFWFLSGYLMELLSRESSDGVRSFLERGTVGLDLVDVLVERISGGSSFPHTRAFDLLNPLLISTPSDSTLGVNVRALVTGLLRARPLELGRVSMGDINWGNVSLAGSHLVGEFERCRFDQLDIRGADCSALRLSTSSIRVLSVDSLTVLGAELPRPDAVRVLSDGAERRVGAEHEKVAALRALISTRTLQDLPLVRIFLRFSKRALTQFFLAEDPRDSRSGDIIRDSDWPKLRELLVKHNLLDADTRSTSGTKKTLLRLKDPESLLSGRNIHGGPEKAIESFWSDLLAEAVAGS